MQALLKSDYKKFVFLPIYLKLYDEDLSFKNLFQ